MTQPACQEFATVHRFENGLTVATEYLPYLHSFSAGIWVRTGSAHETEQQGGLAHFLEHLFFKGTKTRNVHQVMEAIEGRGGQLNAFTSREYTCLYVKMLSSHANIGIEILADIFKNSLFTDWEKERNVILEEISSVEDSPDDYVHDLLSEFHWPNHALGRPVAGTQKSVSALTRDDVVAFFKQWYQPENVVISIAGNFDVDAVLAQLRDEFEGLPNTPAPAPVDAPVFNQGINRIERDISQIHFCMAFPGLTYNSPERHTCDMLSSVLGGGATSRLFERIREEEGLAYAIYTFTGFHRATGVLGLYEATAPGHFEQSLSLICEELRRVREELIPEQELDSHREQIKGNMLMALESTSTRMARMAKSLMCYGRIVPVEEVLGKFEAITQADIQAYAQKTFTKDQCALVVLGPSKDLVVEGVAL